MIMKNLMLVFLIFIATTACKENKSILKQPAASASKDTLVSKPVSQKDIYINKEFFSGDELSDVETFKTGKTTVDSMSYSIYKVRNTGDYIFSLEKFLKNDDVEKYRITDTVNLKSANVRLNEENVSNRKVLLLNSNQKLLKKWVFTHDVTSKTQAKWFGNFSCRFLRMKEESGDLRGWGTIKIDIKNNSEKFQLDSYVENIKKDLMILSQNENEIILSEKNDRNSTFTITKNDNKYFLKSNFINKTVGENDTYQLLKQ